jgi:hypothetical protein
LPQTHFKVGELCSNVSPHNGDKFGAWQAGERKIAQKGIFERSVTRKKQFAFCAPKNSSDL